MQVQSLRPGRGGGRVETGGVWESSSLVFRQGGLFPEGPLTHYDRIVCARAYLLRKTITTNSINENQGGKKTTTGTELSELGGLPARNMQDIFNTQIGAKG